MNITLLPGKISGSISAPPSKSFMHRALICASISENETIIECDSFSEDISATIHCLENLGCRFKREGKYLRVIPIKNTPENTCFLHCNESGSTLRFILPFASSLGAECIINGSERLSKRPLEPLCRALNLHGVKTEYTGSFLPLKVSGELSEGEYSITGEISSQFISGLLMALSKKGGKVIIEGKMKSSKYVDITLFVMQKFNIDVKKTSYGYEVKKSRIISPGHIKCEGDWSNGAFLLVAGALGGEVEVSSLSLDSTQGDKRIFSIMQEMGCDIREENGIIKVKKSPMHSVIIDAEDIPDLVPVLAVLSQASEGKTIIKNIKRLRDKESDRIESTKNLILSLGGNIEIFDNSIEITGPASLEGGEIYSYNDHRIAMSGACASLLCKNPVTIKDATAVKKSYPDFYEKFRGLEK